MSPINFADLSTERPELATVWDQFSEWIQARPNIRIIEPRALARAFRNVSALDLVTACAIMADRGILHPAFMVQTDNGQLVGAPYSSPADIPPKISGSFEGFIDTNEATIVAVYVEGQAGG